jgi:hypothetical protein
VLLLTVALAICAIGTTSAAEPATQPAATSQPSLSSAYTQLGDALRTNDVAALDELIAADFLLIDHEGKASTKDSLLQAFRDGIITMRTLQVSMSSLKDFGTAGVVQGPITLQMTYGKQLPLEINARFAVTCVFVLQDGHWRLTAAQMSKRNAPKPQ